MLMHSKAFAAGSSALLFAASMCSAAPLPILMQGSVMIGNTGSTNTLGYIIYVSPKGEIQFGKVSFPGSFSISREVHFEKASLPKAQTKTLFLHLNAAGPLSALSVRHGMRSASFGTSTYVTYKGQQSPDLTLPGNPKAQALHDDIAAIVRTLHLGGPRRFMRDEPTLVPGLVHKP